MKKIFIVMVAVLFITGCGHNIVNYSDGIGFETTFRPDSGNFGITFRYGKILSVVARENTEIEMNGEGQGGSANEPGGSASATGSVKIKIGQQVNGYTIDAIAAGAKLEDLKNFTAPKEEVKK